MSGFISRISIASIFITSLALIGCGGGGGGDAGVAAPVYSGSTVQALITDANSKELSTTATEASSEAVDNNDSNPFAISITSGSSEYITQATDAAKSIIDNMQSNNGDLPVGLVLGASDLSSFLQGYCGGTVTVPDNFGQDGTLNGSMVFNAVCINDGGIQITMNGTVQFIDNNTSFTISFINFTASDGVNTETINATLTCDSAFGSCSISTVYVGTDGKTYKIENLTVTEIASGVFTITGRFFHPDHGYVDLLTTTSIAYNCPTDGRPGSGELVLTGSNGTITVTFIDCASYSVAFSGGATTVHNW